MELEKEEQEFIVDKLWNNNCPSITKPRIIGFYSVDKHKKSSADFSQLKYLVPTYKDGDIFLDLDALSNNVLKKPATQGPYKLDLLLKYISLHSGKFKAHSDTSKWLRPDFISYRGLITLIWSTPYEKYYGWVITACKFRGNIYLSTHDTEEYINDQTNMTPQRQKMCTWGRTFEKYLLTDDPHKKPDLDNPIYEQEEFNCIYETRFSSHDLIYGAEMDGIKKNDIIKMNDELNLVEFIELKTNRIIRNYKQEQILTKKMLKWWVQSFLVGIREIICGFRNDNGIVYELVTYNISDLPKLGKNEWRAGSAMNFGDEFLSFIKSKVKKNYDECVYTFTWNPGTTVTVNEESPKSEYAFLPQWYTYSEQH